MRRVHELLEPAVAERVIFDLGLVRNIGYYTGAVFEVYDPALGAPIGGGGRYDDLLGRFGRSAARGRLRARRRPPAHRARRRGARHRCAARGDDRRQASAHEPHQRPHDRGAARRAVRRHRRPARRARARHRGAALERPQAAVRGHRRDHDAPLRRADLRRGRRRRPRRSPARTCCSSRRAQRPGEGGREVYELLDLGYGRCTMVLASKAGPDPALEALRRLGVMRVATKYPRIAARHLEETGRQAEIVEVKGSVELAPLTGMVEAIVDLTATGTTLRENNLVVREEIVVCTARLIANPVAHKLKAAAIDDLLARLRGLAAGRRRLSMRIERLDARRGSPRSGARAGAAAHLRALVPAGASVEPAGARDHRRACARRATRRCATTRASFDTAGTEPRPLLVRAEELDEAIKLLPLELVAGLQVAIANVALVAEAGVGDDAAVELPQGQRITLREVPVRLGRRLRARRPRAVPEHGRDGRRHRARGRRARRRGVRAAGRRTAQIDPVILGTCRLCGVERVYRMGGAQAIAALAHGTETVEPRRRDRRAREPLRAGGQAPALGDRRHRRLRRPERPARRSSAPARRARAAAGRARHARPGRARRGQPRRGVAAPRRELCDGLAATLERPGRRAPDRRRGGVRARRSPRRRARRSRWPTRSRRSTCS